jgi:heme-degrading monooxygenase HmoA
VIVRTWRGWVRTEDAANYVVYIDETGLREYREAPGNLAAFVLRRDLEDGRTEFVAVSFWESMDAIRPFAGDDVTAAVSYPDDEHEQLFVDREDTVTHFDVASAAAAAEWAASLPLRTVRMAPRAFAPCLLADVTRDVGASGRC